MYIRLKVKVELFDETKPEDEESITHIWTGRRNIILTSSNTNAQAAINKDLKKLALEAAQVIKEHQDAKKL